MRKRELKNLLKNKKGLLLSRFEHVLGLKTCFVFRSRRGDASVASFRRGRSICLRMKNPTKYSDKENFARNCIFETSSN